MPKEILTLYTKLFVNRGTADENLIDLLSTPDLGIGDPEKVEVTNLQDGTRRYVNGLKDVGDSLEFEFNYVTDNYQVLKEIEESKQIYTYKVVLPDKLCFMFKAALSVKITGAAVGEQVKMTINLTPYSFIDVVQYEDNAGQQGRYSTFTIGQSRARSAGTLSLYGNAENPIEELYINDVAQTLPIGTINENEPVATNYEVNPGDIVKIKGGFSLMRTELPLEDVVLQSDLTNCMGMFGECAGLTEAPVIPSSVTNCMGMFVMCTGLTEAPVIPSSARDCSYMFAGCESLTEAPIIPSSVIDCSYMFVGCSNLTTIPQENIDLMNNPREGLMFEDCYMECPLVADSIPTSWGGTKVEEPEEVPGLYTTFTVGESGTLNLANISSGSITELYIDDVSQELPTGTSFNQTSEYIVENGQKIKIKGSFSLNETTLLIKDIVLQNDLESCNHMFYHCTNLTEGPEIPNSVTTCSRMFEGCTSLTQTSVISTTVNNCTNMFYGCRSLVVAPVIPSSVIYCSSMFEGCTSLTQAAIIPSSVKYCDHMFSGCTNLAIIPEENINLMNNLPKGLRYNNCYTGCSLVADMILMSWGGNKEDAPGFYTTFTVGESGTLKLANMSYGSVEKLYINNVEKELPTGTNYKTTSTYSVENGQKIKIKGSFSLNGTTLLIKDIVLQNDLEDCSNMFTYCTGLTKAPVIPSSVTNCMNMFANCTGLITLPPENVELMNNPPEGLKHSYCYWNSRNIADPITYDEIPSGWK